MGIGVAVKVADGRPRAAAPAMVETLAQLGALDARHRRALEPIARPPVHGGDDVVGAIEPVVAIRRR
jgi:L-asparaginase II